MMELMLAFDESWSFLKLVVGRTVVASAGFIASSMPYIAVLIEEQAAAMLTAAAAQMASGSAFVAEQRPMHVTMVGTLHRHVESPTRSATKTTP